jgi:hypothetical protein
MSTQQYSCDKCLADMDINIDRENMSFSCPECENSRIYSVPTGRLLTIGIELEGGFSCLPDRDDISYDTHEDSSVEIEGGYNEDCECSGCCDGDECDYRGDYEFVGELVSPVLPITAWQHWVRKCYPSEHNESCGGHVHFGVSNISAYENLNCQEFHNYFVRELKAWGKRANIRNDNFWSRINGENSMCKDEYEGKEQLAVRDEGYPSCRYCILNFQYDKHRTVECRVLPVFESPSTMISAIKAVIRIFNAWLKSAGFNDITKDESDIIVPDFSGKIKSTIVTEV